jgi:hypothetical protein
VDVFKKSDESKAGLCATCRHVKENRSDRGAVFFYCRKSETDPTFRKYPPLPVLDCRGYERVSGPGTA